MKGKEVLWPALAKQGMHFNRGFMLQKISPLVIEILRMGTVENTL